MGEKRSMGRIASGQGKNQCPIIPKSRVGVNASRFHERSALVGSHGGAMMHHPAQWIVTFTWET